MALMQDVELFLLERRDLAPGDGGRFTQAPKPDLAPDPVGRVQIGRLTSRCAPAGVTVPGYSSMKSCTDATPRRPLEAATSATRTTRPIGSEVDEPRGATLDPGAERQHRHDHRDSERDPDAVSTVRATCRRRSTSDRCFGSCWAERRRVKSRV